MLNELDNIIKEIQILLTNNSNNLNNNVHKEFLIKKNNILDKLNKYTKNDIFNMKIFQNLYFENNEQENIYMLLLIDDMYNECEFYDAIYYFEDKKNKYRCRDKEYFEYYNKLQELFYKKMELVYPNEKNDIIQDKWNKNIEEVIEE